MSHGWLTLRLRSSGGRPALNLRAERSSFARRHYGSHARLDHLARHRVDPGGTLAIYGDCSPCLFALFSTALGDRNIIVLLARR
jgi:hypothetical protein